MKLGVFEINYGKCKHIESFPHQKTPKSTTWEIWVFLAYKEPKHHLLLGG